MAWSKNRRTGGSLLQVRSGSLDLTAFPIALGNPSSTVTAYVQAGAVTGVLLYPTPTRTSEATRRTLGKDSFAATGWPCLAAPAPWLVGRGLCPAGRGPSPVGRGPRPVGRGLCLLVEDPVRLAVDLRSLVEDLVQLAEGLRSQVEDLVQLAEGLRPRVEDLLR
jgi:hypothetical protein